MKKETTTIRGYLVEAEPYADGREERLAVQVTKGEHSATLNYLVQTHYLYDEFGNDSHEVVEATVDEIAAWAEARGW